MSGCRNHYSASWRCLPCRRSLTRRFWVHPELGTLAVVRRAWKGRAPIRDNLDMPGATELAPWWVLRPGVSLSASHSSEPGRWRLVDHDEPGLQVERLT
jgi:hypothetical protein